MGNFFGKIKNFLGNRINSKNDFLKNYLDEQIALKNRQMMKFVYEIEDLKREICYLKSDLEENRKLFTGLKVVEYFQ